MHLGLLCAVRHRNRLIVVTNMPRSNRKKRSSEAGPKSPPKATTFSHSKREYRDIGDGWTQVADKSWKKAVAREDFSGIGPLSDMTLLEMEREFGRYKKQWESSDAYTQLLAYLSNISRDEIATIRVGVCLGLGSLQALSMDWRRSCHTQLAALQTIYKFLLEAGAPLDKIIMQDPRFTDLDKAFLAAQGYNVVDSPLAWTHIRRESLIYAPHFPTDLFSNITITARPAVMICNNLRNSMLQATGIPQNNVVNFPQKADGNNIDTAINDLTVQLQEGVEMKENTGSIDGHLLSLTEDCEETPFPQLRYDFSDMMIYWRQSKTSGEIGTEALRS